MHDVVDLKVDVKHFFKRHLLQLNKMMNKNFVEGRKNTQKLTICGYFHEKNIHEITKE